MWIIILGMKELHVSKKCCIIFFSGQTLNNCDVGRAYYWICVDCRLIEHVNSFQTHMNLAKKNFDHKKIVENVQKSFSFSNNILGFEL